MPDSPADGTSPADGAVAAGLDALPWAHRRGVGALAEKMGFEWIELSDKRAVGRMPVEGNTQPVGLFHGGAYVVLGESLGSMHANWLAGPGRLAVGVDVNATHTRSAASGFVTGVCTPLHVGRSMTVHEVVLTDDDGRRCSTVRITNRLIAAPSAER
ncbi:MAG: hotdog fold thioesterase [Microbacterium sp.]|uniref:hotdog fold thioesterase n=1 Tax=Microbacterium sp. TaxID=51671 RepID=UPI0039E6860F